MQAVGREPAGMALSLGDPVEQQDLPRVRSRRGALGGGVRARPAAQLAVGDEDEQPAAAQEVQRLVDIRRRDRPVGPERDHHHVGHRVLCAQRGEHVVGLEVLATAVGVGVEPLGRESRQRQDHRRIAERERRQLTGRVRCRGRGLGAAALGAADRREGQGGEDRHERDRSERAPELTRAAPHGVDTARSGGPMPHDGRPRTSSGRGAGATCVYDLRPDHPSKLGVARWCVC